MEEDICQVKRCRKKAELTVEDVLLCDKHWKEYCESNMDFLEWAKQRVL